MDLEVFLNMIMYFIINWQETKIMFKLGMVLGGFTPKLSLVLGCVPGCLNPGAFRAIAACVCTC